MSIITQIQENENISYQLDSLTFPLSPIVWDHMFVTDTWDNTWVVSEQWIYDWATWFNETIAWWTGSLSWSWTVDYLSKFTSPTNLWDSRVSDLWTWMLFESNWLASKMVLKNNIWSVVDMWFFWDYWYNFWQYLSCNEPTYSSYFRFYTPDWWTTINWKLNWNLHLSESWFGKVIVGTWIDNTIDELQVNWTISADQATLSNQVVIKSQLDTKQDTLISWTNIRTVNWNSLLWSWDLAIAPWGIDWVVYRQLQNWWVNDRHFFPVMPISANFGTGAPLVNAIIYTPFILDRDISITEIWILSRAAWWNFLVGIYNSLSDKPYQLLASSPLTTNAAAVYYPSTVSVTLLKWTVYWTATLNSEWSFLTTGNAAMYNFMPRSISNLGNNSYWYRQSMTAWWTSLPTTVWVITSSPFMVIWVFYK